MFKVMKLSPRAVHAVMDWLLMVLETELNGAPTLREQGGHEVLF